jgi:hypothetical protein
MEGEMQTLAGFAARQARIARKKEEETKFIIIVAWLAVITCLLIIIALRGG